MSLMILGCGPARPFKKPSQNSGVSEPPSAGVASQLGVRIVPVVSASAEKTCLVTNSHTVLFCDPVEFSSFNAKVNLDQLSDRFLVWEENALSDPIVQVSAQHLVLRKGTNQWQELMPNPRVGFDPQSRRWFVSFNELYLSLLSFFPDLCQISKMSYAQELVLRLRLKSDRVESVSVQFTFNLNNSKCESI